jgi:hypothetical protein
VSKRVWHRCSARQESLSIDERTLAVWLSQFFDFNFFVKWKNQLKNGILFLGQEGQDLPMDFRAFFLKKS